jgi:glycosyltransferase involved in cell wall biosynthesis
MKASSKPDLGVCMPVLNECESLQVLLPEIADCLQGASYSVCVVDDGSTDGSVDS